MKISEQGIAITKRFFLALDLLKESKQIRGIQTFTREHEINRWNLITVKNNPHISILKPEWIYFLCKDYNISTDWIIFGKGNMYDKQTIQLDTRKEK